MVNEIHFRVKEGRKLPYKTALPGFNNKTISESPKLPAKLHQLAK